MKKLFQVFILILTVAFIGGCGVSNESSTGTNGSSESSANERTISGYVIDDPVPNAKVKLLDAEGVELAKSFSDSNGYFTISDVKLDAGSTYCLEAEGNLANQTISMHSCFSLTENVTDDNITVNINPLTEITYKLYKEKGNLSEAEAKVREYFQIPTGRWLGEVNYSNLQGITEGLRTLAELKGKNLPLEVTDLLVSDIANDLGVTSKDVLEMEKRMSGQDIGFDLSPGQDRTGVHRERAGAPRGDRGDHLHKQNCIGAQPSLAYQVDCR